MIDGRILDALCQIADAHLPEVMISEEDLQAREVPIDDTWVTLPAVCIQAAVQELIEEFGIRHLSTITGQDTGTGLQVLYHFWERTGLTLCVELPYQDPHIATLTGLIPGAAYYEREVAEMLGVTFDGHPDPSPLLLPDDWESGAPLRRDFVTPQARRLGLETGPNEGLER
jgi:NADH-quinone oxidoreductase subunit C